MNGLAVIKVIDNTRHLAEVYLMPVQLTGGDLEILLQRPQGASVRLRCLG